MTEVTDSDRERARRLALDCRHDGEWFPTICVEHSAAAIAEARAEGARVEIDRTIADYQPLLDAATKRAETAEAHAREQELLAVQAGADCETQYQRALKAAAEVARLREVGRRLVNAAEPVVDGAGFTVVVIKEVVGVWGEFIAALGDSRGTKS